MKKNKIFILEDEQPHFDSISSKFSESEYKDFFELFPSLSNDSDESLKNIDFFIDKVNTLISENRLSDFELDFKKEYPQIDLFIIDKSLIDDSDGNGIEFLHFLFKINYMSKKFNFIITSNHAPSNINIKFTSFNSQTQYVSKGRWGPNFALQTLNLAKELLK